MIVFYCDILEDSSDLESLAALSLVPKSNKATPLAALAE